MGLGLGNIAWLGAGGTVVSVDVLHEFDVDIAQSLQLSVETTNTFEVDVTVGLSPQQSVGMSNTVTADAAIGTGLSKGVER